MLRKINTEKILHILIALLTAVVLTALSAGAVFADGSSEPASNINTSDFVSSASLNLPDPSAEFYVYDPSGVITDTTKNAILARSRELYQSYGLQTVVAVMGTLNGAEISDFSRELFAEWEIGGDYGRGLLLLVDVAGDSYYSISGENLRGELTSQVLKGYLDSELEPDFAAKNYDAGISKYFTAVSAAAENCAKNNGFKPVAVSEEPSTSENEPNVGSDGEKKSSHPFLSVLKGIGIFILVIVILAAVLIGGLYVYGWYIRRKRKAERSRRK